jgi:hypothetical protein
LKTSTSTTRLANSRPISFSILEGRTLSVSLPYIRLGKFRIGVMGKVSRFIRKITGRAEKNRETQSHVGTPRTATVPPLRRIHQSLLVHTGSNPASELSGSAPIMALPTLDLIPSVSPLRMPTAVPSPSPAPRFSPAYHVESNDQSPATETSTEEVSFQCQGLPALLPRGNTTATIFHPPTPPPPPRITSASFARLPEYMSSPDDSEEEFEVPRTGHGTLNSDIDDTEISDSPGLAMLRPLERPREEDVFSSSSFPDGPGDSDGFALPGPPSYHALPVHECSTPSRRSHRPSRVHMQDEATPQRVRYVGNTHKSNGRATRQRRMQTSYPLDVPNGLPSLPGTTAASPSAIPKPGKIFVYPPHGFPPTPSSELHRKSSFSTRMEQLSETTPLLQCTDDHGNDLQQALLVSRFDLEKTDRSYLSSSSKEESASSAENWVEYAHERTPSEQEEAARAKLEQADSNVPERDCQTWWEDGSRGATPKRDPYGRSGAQASLGFRKGE